MQEDKNNNKIKSPIKITMSSYKLAGAKNNNKENKTLREN